MIPVGPGLQKGVCRQCLRVQMRGEVLGKSFRQACGKQVYVRLTPQVPKPLTYFRMERPFRGENLTLPAEGVCYYILLPTDELGHQRDLIVL